MVILPHSITSRVRYWRTGRGYGVHSPFAYHFITRVLREQLPYYDFEQIERMDVQMAHRHARLLYRLTVFFHPAAVWVGGEYAEIGRMIVAMAHPSVQFTRNAEDADMVVYAKPENGVNLRRGAEATIAFLAESAQWEAFRKASPSGMTFANGRVGVAVCRRGLPRQDYRLNF